MSLTYIREYREDGGIYSEPDAQPGRVLTELLDKSPPPLRACLEIGAAIADILAIAQEDGKTHGDPKIGMVRIDSEGNVAVTDFKPSRRTTRAPEPSPLHPESNIYGLGVILHSLLSPESFGRVPKTEREHNEAVAEKVMRYNFDEAEGQAWLGELKEFICSMMAYSSEARPSPDEVADVLGNAADSLEGLPLDVWAERACTDSTAARGRVEKAPEEELEGVRTLHQLEPDPETELSGPMLVQKALQEAEEGHFSGPLDESLDETILEQPASREQTDGFAFEETIIDELPVETLENAVLSIHEQETLVEEPVSATDFSEETLPAPSSVAPPSTPASEPATKEPSIQAPAQQPPSPPSPSGVIRGPSLPPPPPAGAAPQANPAKSALIGLVVVLAIGAGVFVGMSGGDEDAPLSPPTELPGPISTPEPIEEAPMEETPEEPVQLEELDPSQDAAPEATSEDAPSPAAAPASAAPSPAPDRPAAPAAAPPAAPAPEASPRPAPTPVAAPTPAAAPAPAPEPVPAASAPPYRARVTIEGGDRAITCGDGQSPEVTGPLSLTFQSSQYCRVEIDGGMGILTINSSGTFVCSKSGPQVACAQVR